MQRGGAFLGGWVWEERELLKMGGVSPFTLRAAGGKRYKREWGELISPLNESNIPGDG